MWCSSEDICRSGTGLAMLGEKDAQSTGKVMVGHKAGVCMAGGQMGQYG
jgi:hypothetical protein